MRFLECWKHSRMMNRLQTFRDVEWQWCGQEEVCMFVRHNILWPQTLCKFLWYSHRTVWMFVLDLDSRKSGSRVADWMKTHIWWRKSCQPLLWRLKTGGTVWIVLLRSLRLRWQSALYQPPSPDIYVWWPTNEIRYTRAKKESCWNLYEGC